MKNISIIIPCYCTSEESLEWLGECIDSALSQDCEVVVYDDGSPAYVLSVIKKFGHRIIYSGGVHIGVSHARNQAVKMASGDLIFPLDCDDRLIPGAMNKLMEVWDGITPVYCDVSKFGTENIPHYALLDFDCKHITTHVGFASVNVLHQRDQCSFLGGWNENLDFYEDGEYNARLFATWCGLRYPEPLVQYRIHGEQRTKAYKKVAYRYAKRILDDIRRLDMPCVSCGGKRKSSNTSTFDASQPVAGRSTAVDVNALPGERDGRVLAQYVGGKGKLKHIYRGRSTRFGYKVQFGDYVYADPADVREPDATMDSSLLVRVIQKKAAKVPVPATRKPVVSDEPKVKRSPKEAVERVAVVDLPDIVNMNVKDVMSLEDLDENTALQLLEIERNGRNRVKVRAYLESFIGKDE